MARCLILIVFVLTFVSGCSLVGGKEEKFIQYGVFCGEDHPTAPDSVKNDAQKHADWILYRTKNPIDDIDRVCKYHDVCYALANGVSTACDFALQKNIQSVNENLRMTQHPLKSFGILSYDEKGRPMSECIRKCQSIEMFAVSRHGSKSRLTSISDATLVATGHAAGVLHSALDAVSYGQKDSNSTSMKPIEPCLVTRNLELYSPKTVKEYQNLVRYYEGLLNKSGYEGSGYTPVTVQIRRK